MCPQQAALRARRQPVATPQKHQDACGLCDHKIASLQKRRRKRQPLEARALHESKHLVFAAAPAGDIDVIGAGLFKRKPYEFAAALDLGPIVELITHGTRPSSVVRWPNDQKPGASRQWTARPI